MAWNSTHPEMEIWDEHNGNLAPSLSPPEGINDSCNLNVNDCRHTKRRQEREAERKNRRNVNQTTKTQIYADTCSSPNITGCMYILDLFFFPFVFHYAIVIPGVMKSIWPLLTCSHYKVITSKRGSQA